MSLNIKLFFKTLGLQGWKRRSGCGDYSNGVSDKCIMQVASCRPNNQLKYLFYLKSKNGAYNNTERAFVCPQGPAAITCQSVRLSVRRNSRTAE